MNPQKFNPYDLASKKPAAPAFQTGETKSETPLPAAPSPAIAAQAAKPINAADISKVEVRPELVDPLNVFLGRCEMLLERSKAVNQTELMFELQKIYSSAKYLLSVITNSATIKRAVLTFDSGSSSAFSAQQKTAAPPANTDESSLVGPGTILLVDDDATLLETMQLYLEACGHTVSIARGGKEGLVALQSKEFELLLVDLMMPEMDGYQFLTFMKANMSWRDIPVIIFSGLRETTSAARCLEMGANDYLTKPIDPVLLRARINACLEQKRLRSMKKQLLEKIQNEPAK